MFQRALTGKIIDRGAASKQYGWRTLEAGVSWSRGTREYIHQKSYRNINIPNDL